MRDSILDLVKIEPVYTSEEKAVVKGLDDGIKMINKPVSGAYAGMPVKIFQEKESAKSQN